MAQVTNDKIIWGAEDWYGGFDDIDTSSPTLYSLKANKNTLIYARNCDPYRNPGYASVGRDTVSVTLDPVDDGGISGVLRNSVSWNFTTDSPTGIYEIGITASGRLIMFNSTTTVDATSSSFYHTISPHAGHTSVVGRDIIKYNAKVGGTSKNAFLYSWTDNTDWDIGIRYGTSADSMDVDDDMMSTKAESPLAGTDLTDGQNVEHPMVVGDDDVLYIGSGRYLHGYDGQVGNDGTFYSKVLTLPLGYIITSMQKYGTYLVIFAHNNDTTSVGYSTAKAFFWDYLSLDPTKIVDLKDNVCSESFIYGSSLGVFTSGRIRDNLYTGLSKCQLFNGNYFEPIAYFSEDIPIKGGVEVAGDQIMWNSVGRIYCYGNNLGLPKTLNWLTSGTTTSSGMLNSHTRTYLASSGTLNVGGLYKLTGYKASGELITKTVEPAFPEGKKGRIKYVQVKYGKVEATPGRKVDIKLRYNRGASTITLATDDYPASESELIKKYEHDTSGAELPSFTDVSLDLVWKTGTDNTDAPLIAEVEVFYELINI
jgi:hypothetical protein